MSKYPWRHAYPQAIADTPLAHERLEPVAVLSGDRRCLPALLDGGDGEILLDFGEERVGYVTLEVACPGATELRACYGEYLDEARQAFPSPLSWYRDPEDRFALRAGEHTLRSGGRRAFRYVRLTAAAPTTVRSVRVETEQYPVHERGRFRCSDELLNRIWDISCRTTRLCMQRFYEDGIKRDGMLWIGDYRVQYLCNAMAFGDVDLARKSLFIMAASQREDGALPACSAISGGHPYPHRIEYMPGLPEGVQHWSLINYCTDFVSAVHEFWWHTGEVETVRKLWPCLQRLLRYLREDVDPARAEPSNAVRDLSRPNFSTDNCDSSTVGEFFSRAGLHMEFCGALRDAARLASGLGETGAASAWQASYDAEAARARQLAWDERRGVFADNGVVSWHANARSVLAGVTPAGAPARALLERLLTMTDVVRPVAGMPRFHVLWALFEAGLGRAALDWIRRDWGRVVAVGLTTCPEGITENIDKLFHHEPERGQGGINDRQMWSLCHGWSAGPAYLLPAYVLGVRPTEPGYAAHTDEPQLGDLAWAEGTIPTPHGDLQETAK